ncbi:MAG: monovalent cation/H(+) antiporter subunit G [Rhizomicrobium sp.]
MTGAAVGIFLAIAVICAWLGAIAFVRLKSALDRLHCASFVGVASGTSLLVAVFIADGASGRAFKTVFLVAASVIAAAASSHAVGRAILIREKSRK